MEQITKAYIEAMIDELRQHKKYLLDCFMVKQAEQMEKTIDQLKESIYES